jgi:CO/xanthine dehydrogenase FAD-binding subunit
MPGHALTDALRHIMGPAVRNIATIGGSVMGRFGFSDVITVLLALDAELNFHQRGKMPMNAFLDKRPFGKDILKTILIPRDVDHTWFHKVSTTRLDFATLNIAISKTRQDIRIVIGSRPQLAVLAEQAMAFLNEKKTIDKDVIDEAADLVCDEIAFSSDTRASAGYRKTLAREYVLRGLKEVHGL